MAAARFRGPGSLIPRTRFPSEADGGSAGLLRGSIVCVPSIYVCVYFERCMRVGIQALCECNEKKKKKKRSGQNEAITVPSSLVSQGAG